MKLLIKPFNEKIKLFYSNHGHFHEGDAGLDLYAIKEQVIKKKSTNKIHFGIACENFDSRPYLLMPRSSISKTPLRMSNSIGLIDGGYRGEIMASVDNISDEDYTIKKKQRLFQIVSMQGEQIQILLVDNLTDTGRGFGGFGSTGKWGLLPICRIYLFYDTKWNKKCIGINFALRINVSILCKMSILHYNTI